MLTILFYTSNGLAAKLRSRKIAAINKTSFIRVIDAGFWDGEPMQCDAVEIMPEAPGWQRKRIEAVFGSKVVESVGEAAEEVDVEKPRLKSMGLLPPKDEQSEKKAVHRGGGRWFVMAGEDIISGPHDKAEAKRLATPSEEAV